MIVINSREDFIKYRYKINELKIEIENLKKEYDKEFSRINYPKDLEHFISCLPWIRESIKKEVKRKLKYIKLKQYRRKKKILEIESGLVKYIKESQDDSLIYFLINS